MIPSHILHIPHLTHLAHLRAALAAMALVGSAMSAQAATITFDGLPGTSGEPFISYTQDGFTVTPTGGNWLQAQTFGAPLPSLYAVDLHGAPFGSLSVTAAAPFVFESFDFAPGLSAAGYEVRGYKGGVQQFSFSGSEAPTGGFHTLASPLRQGIDMLAIDVSGAGPGSVNVDNIRVSAVPEPQAWSLALAGLAMAGLAVRRSRN